MNDQEFINSIETRATEELFDALENIGCDGYFKDIWSSVLGELKHRIKALEQKSTQLPEIPKDYNYDTETNVLKILEELKSSPYDFGRDFGKEVLKNIEEDKNHAQKSNPTYTLQQESSEDCVSRQAILDMATTIQTDDYSGNEIMEVVDIDDVKALPPVTPTQKWIPISERLPDAQKDGDKDFSDWVQVTINLGKDNPSCVSEAYYCFSANKWYTERIVIGEIVAWQPLPQPYRETEKEISNTKENIEDEIEVER